MGLDIYFGEDIRNALLAANEASSATAAVATSRDTRTLDRIAQTLREELAEGSQALLDVLHAAALGNVDAMRQYRRGYKAALTTVALAFGLSPALIDGGKPLEVPVLSGVEGPSAIGYQPSALSHLPEKR